MSLWKCAKSHICAVEDWKNEALYVSSFLVSQRDMLDSVHKVLRRLGQKMEYYVRALERARYAQAMYTQVFYQNGDGNYEAAQGLANERLGLPKEDLDAVTKWAVKKKLNDGFVHEGQ
ncbi:hypothetical protein PMIN04_004467 [Paraphaeosphaeria minitans]